MSESGSSNLYRRISRLRWQAPVLAFILVLGHQIIEHTLLIDLPRWGHFASQVLFYGLVGPLLAWWALTSLRRSVLETEAAESALRTAHSDLSKSKERLEFLMRVNRRLAEAEDEESLSAAIVELPQEVLPTLGCSLVRFDERHQPLAAVHHGHLDLSLLEKWSANLVDFQSRRTCSRCSKLDADLDAACPLLAATAEFLPATKVHCLSLRRGGQRYGVLNILLEDPQRPTAGEESLLEAMAHEMSLALESQALRAREMAMLSRLQKARNLNNLREELSGILSHSQEALGADGSVLFLREQDKEELGIFALEGHLPGKSLDLVKGLAAGAVQAAEPMIVGNLEGGGSSGTHSLLMSPLRTEDRSLGCLALWSGTAGVFTRRQARLVGIVASQVALIIENHRLYLQGEHQAALAERARLAREIHDGLAQTLGYMKLLTTQIAAWLRSGDIVQVEDGLDELQLLLDESYLDAREAIDALHTQLNTGDVAEWTREILSDFENLSGIGVEVKLDGEITFPPEVHLQLQRILQEALSNIRKHADATRVSLSWDADEHWITLSVQDNGRGFDPEDVLPSAQHGLRIMRERAELLDADFQVTSRPDEGALIVVRLPCETPVRDTDDE